jgi:hypothetical protein
MQNSLNPLRTFAAVTAILVIVLSACSAPSSPSSSAPSSAPPANPSPSAVAAGPLVTVETQGGECMQGACGGVVVVDTDGHVHTAPPESKQLGVVPEATLQALTTEIEQADFAAIKSRPFTHTCPIAFDGQQLIYTFATPNGDERIDSCQVIVDPAHPLFAAVEAALVAGGAR